MRLRWRASLIVLAAATVSAQAETAVVRRPQLQAPTFTVRSELVVVHVTVADQQGRYVTGLPQSAFQVTENGAPQQIDFFTGEDSPLTVGFLVDSSGSMREGRERVIAAATAFAESSHSQDELFALAFNEHVRPALPPSMPFTNNAAVLRSALTRTIGARGLTALYDALANGLAYVAKGHHSRRVLIVVGDGGDNASATTIDRVLKAAQSSNAAIYAVGVVDRLDRDANPSLLKKLAHATGGEAHFPRNLDDVDAAMRKISDDIRHSYTIGYVSSNSVRDGQFRRIRVGVTDPARRSLIVRARDGYRAGGPHEGAEFDAPKSN